MLLRFLYAWHVDLLVFAFILQITQVSIAEQNSENLTKELGIVSVSRGSSLIVKLIPQPRCYFGDLDLIYRESLRLPKGGRIIATLERLEQGNAIPAMGLHEFYSSEGTSYVADFLIRTDLVAGAYGIFICSDSSGEAKSCANANALPFEELLANYEVSVSEDGTKGALARDRLESLNQDHLYFFQPIVITKDSIFVASKAVLANPGIDRGIKDFFMSLATPELASTDVARAAYIDAAITSTPLVVENEGLGVVLPFYSPPKCG